MSDFDDFNDSAWTDSIATIGTTSFTLSNTAYTGGVFNEFAAAKQMADGGFMGEYDATLMVVATAFSNIAAPVERTVEGAVVVISGRSFRVEKALSDSLTITLLLANKNKTT